MDNTEIATMPVTVHEYSEQRWEGVVRMLIKVVAFLVIANIVLGGICAYLIYDRSQYDYATVTVDSEDSGIANYMGANASGEINNGSNSSSNKDAQESEKD